jgi:phosphoserine phosphatase
MTTTTLYLTRHGQTVWNEERRMQGHGDSPLTDLGVQQATWLGASLQNVPFDVIYSSSSPRAQRTAELIRGDRALPIILCDDLREIAVGTWEGRIATELDLEEPEERYNFWHSPHLYTAKNGGETFFDLQKRVIPRIQELVAKHEGQQILFVMHAITLKVVMAYFMQRPLEQLWDSQPIHPTSLSKVVIKEGKPTVEMYADISHYQAEPGPTMQVRNAVETSTRD